MAGEGFKCLVPPDLVVRRVAEKAYAAGDVGLTAHVNHTQRGYIGTMSSQYVMGFWRRDVAKGEIGELVVGCNQVKVPKENHYGANTENEAAKRTWEGGHILSWYVGAPTGRGWTSLEDDGGNQVMRARDPSKWLGRWEREVESELVALNRNSQDASNRLADPTAIIYEPAPVTQPWGIIIFQPLRY